MNRVKYVVHGGYVTSRSDGDEHFIGFRQLCDLYGINPAECIYDDPHNSERLRGYKRDYINSLVHLYVRNDGNYNFIREKRP